MRLALETIDSGRAWRNSSAFAQPKAVCVSPPSPVCRTTDRGAMQGESVHRQPQARSTGQTGGEHRRAWPPASACMCGWAMRSHAAKHCYACNAQTQGELAYARSYANEVGEIVRSSTKGSQSYIAPRLFLVPIPR